MTIARQCASQLKKDEKRTYKRAVCRLCQQNAAGLVSRMHALTHMSTVPRLSMQTIVKGQAKTKPSADPPNVDLRQFRLKIGSQWSSNELRILYRAYSRPVS